VRADLGVPGIDQQVNASALQSRSRGFFAGRQERAGERVGEELGDNAGFKDEFVVEEAGDGVGDRGHEAAGVEVQVPLRAGLAEVDNDLFVRQVQLCEGNMGAVCVGTAVVGVDCDFRRCWTVVYIWASVGGGSAVGVGGHSVVEGGGDELSWSFGKWRGAESRGLC